MESRVQTDLRRIEFFVVGQPIPKARPRVSARGTYTPTRTRDWEDLIGMSAKIAMAVERYVIFTGPVEVELRVSGANALADVDNLGKACLDAMNGVVYTDDRQIDCLVVERLHDDKRGVDIRVTAL